MIVYTKQHIKVLEELEKIGRYITKEEFIEKDLGPLERKYVLEAYGVLSRFGPNIHKKPGDVKYPIWLALTKDNTMLLGKDEVILALEVDKDDITLINMEKWATILNLSYIAKDEEDRKNHYRELEKYNISDTKAYMSEFYPFIKRKIKASWERLFNYEDKLYGNNYYGNIWEIRREWIREIIRK